MKKMVCFVGKMDTGGAETFLMKLFRAIDRSKFQMDFIVSDKTPGFYDEEIKSLGGEIHYVPAKSSNLIGYIKSSYRLLKNKKYESVIRVSSHSLGTMDLIIAKFAGTPNLVLRSTNAGSDGGILSMLTHKMFFFLPRVIPTVKFAPSKLAGEYLFGKSSSANITYLKNGIPLDIYKYDEIKRNNIRKMLGLEDNFIVGHIGRFNIQKNHDFLIKIFAEYSRVNKKAVLILIGKGELEDNIKEKIRKLNLENKVKFLGIRKDIPDLLMAMDIMLFPSHFEGMPNVIIEAQATGLPCIISDRITKEVLINKSIIQLDIECESEWVKRIDKIIKDNDRSEGVSNLKIAGYDIECVSNIFINKVFNIKDN